MTRFITLFAALSFLAAPALAQTPPEIQKITDQNFAACREAGGNPSIADGYLTERDMNGDGKPDYVMNLSGLTCENAYSYFCGSAGCPVTAWASSPTGLQVIWEGYAQDVQFEGNTMVAFLHGQFCDPPAAGVDGCEERIAFDAPAAAAAPAADPAPADTPPPSDRWELRQPAGSPAVAVIGGPGNLRSMAAFCLQGQPWLALLFHQSTVSDTVQVAFGFSSQPMAGPATRSAGTGGTYVIGLANNPLVGLLAGRDSQVVFSADGVALGAISLSGSTKALRGALSACMKL